MMRIILISLAALVAAVSGCPVVAQTVPMGPCSDLHAASGGASPASRANSLALLGSITQMLSPLGRPVMASNLATTVAINNSAPPALRAQALIDAQITGENANTVADGLGATMAKIYRDRAVYESRNDGATSYCGQIGPAVTALIAAANATSRGDSAAGKLGYADPKTKTFPLPPGGTYDAIGQAYGLDPNAKGADPNGDPRPFQTAPLDATSGPRIETYDGTDFFGVATNSRLMLVGAGHDLGRTGSNLTASPSYPSGHTTFGYTEALLLAMMVPERYRALAYRGSEYGDSRIVIGAHYAIDVIGGRTLATYDLAQNLAGTKGYAQVGTAPFRASLAAAATELRADLLESLPKSGCAGIAACAARDPIVRAENAGVLTGGTFRPATTAQAYAFRLTYGLTPMGSQDRPPDPVPVEAGTLLETRFPYLTAAQRLDVLRLSEGPSGRFLDVSPLDGTPFGAGAKGPQAQVGVYSRLNLYAAAGGYPSFSGQVVVTQDAGSIRDPDLRPFLDLARADTWSNDIDGAGGLTKRGAGTLTLSGANTYAGPTIVEGGTLEVAGSITSATEVKQGGTLLGAGEVGNVAISRGGTLAPGDPDGAGGLRISGSFEMADGGVYVLRRPTADRALQVAGAANLDGARLVVKAGPGLHPGVRLPILNAAGGVHGTFAEVTVDAPALAAKLVYEKAAVYLALGAKSAAGAPPN